MHEIARSNARLAQHFYAASYGRGQSDVADYLRQGQRQGFILGHLDAEDLADNIISMWEGLRFVRARLSLNDQPFDDPKGWSQHCVALLFENTAVTTSN